MHKDKNEKTHVHRNGCPHLGKRGTFDCAGPLRLSDKTVDSCISIVNYERSSTLLGVTGNGLDALALETRLQINC